MGVGAALAGAVRARGRFDRMIRDTALRHAAGTSRARVVADIRGMAGSRRRAPGVTHLEPLVDVLVHGQDIALPLGRPHPVPAGAAATAATRIWTMGWPLRTAFPGRRRLAGLQLTATDTAWSVGHGDRVEGPIAALLLLLAGRPAALDRLGGPGAAHLTLRGAAADGERPSGSGVGPGAAGCQP
jgi:uncharacterized protein (TIGR03083 family)